MIRINSFSVFLKYILIIFFVFYFLFKIGNYFYNGNYCDYWSDVVQENSLEDIEETKKCVYTLLCEVGNIRLSLSDDMSNQRMKSFSCIRKYEPGVWNW